MKNPNPDRIDDMCDAFMWYHEKFHEPVNMDAIGVVNPELKENYCSSPGCHAGLFACLYEDDRRVVPPRIFSYGAVMMTQYLFGDYNIRSESKLERWAHHSGHWPNSYGDRMFYSGNAFSAESLMLPIPQIVKVWKQAAKSIRESMK